MAEVIDLFVGTARGGSRVERVRSSLAVLEASLGAEGGLNVGFETLAGPDKDIRTDVADTLALRWLELGVPITQGEAAAMRVFSVASRDIQRRLVRTLASQGRQDFAARLVDASGAPAKTVAHLRLLLAGDAAGGDPAAVDGKVSITPAVREVLACSGLRIPAGEYVTRTLVEAPVALLAGLTSWAPNRVGAFTYAWSHLAPQVGFIGRYCSIASDVRFAEFAPPADWLTTSNVSYEPEFWLGFEGMEGPPVAPAELPVEGRWGHITLGNDVRIGRGAYIGGGVTLADGVVVEVGAVVLEDAPPYAIIAGNPAYIVGYRFDEPTISRLLAAQWWRHSPRDLATVDVRNVHLALDQVEAITGPPWEPGWTSIPDLARTAWGQHEF